MAEQKKGTELFFLNPFPSVPVSVATAPAFSWLAALPAAVSIANVQPTAKSDFRCCLFIMSSSLYLLQILENFL